MTTEQYQKMLEGLLSRSYISVEEYNVLMQLRFTGSHIVLNALKRVALKMFMEGDHSPLTETVRLGIKACYL